MAVYRNVVSALRLADVSGSIKDAAFQLQLDLEIDIDKGWLRETVRFTVMGPDVKVIAFRSWLSEACQAYQTGESVDVDSDGDNRVRHSTYY